MSQIAHRETANDLSIIDAYDSDTELSDSTMRRIVESVPESTRRVYAGDWERFGTWAATRNRTPLPATPETLAEYTNHLADQRLAPPTIDRALAAIATAHETAGRAKPNPKLARAALRAYRREWAEAGNGTRKAKAITIDVLRALVATVDPDTPAGVRDRALMVIGFSFAARRSELVALNLDDISEQPEGIEVSVRRSKTDKNSEGRVVAIPYGANPDTCPVRTLRAWIGYLASQGHTDGPLFVRVDRHGRLGTAAAGRVARDGRLTGQAVAIVINRAALRAGLDSNAAWSGHSLRRGFATETYRAGAHQFSIARQGGWKENSAVLAGYIEEVERWKKNPLIGVGL